MNALVLELKPRHRKKQACQPYELFPVARQKRVDQQKPVRNGSSLAPKFIPNAPNATTSLSMIETCRGANLAMGRGDTDDPPV